MKTKSILIAAGGTGGHVFPGLAIAHEFEQRGFQVEWLGTEVGLESRLVPINGIKLNFFPVSGIRGLGISAQILAPFRVLRSLISAIKIIRKIDPVLVVGMGGFVSGPAGVAAFLTGRALVIHEQNAVPGTTNKLLSLIATRTMSAFPVKLKNATVIGNPVRENLERIEKTIDIDKAKINVLVLGGSRGARALNLNLASAIKIAGVVDDISVRHQCGEGREMEAKAVYAGSGIDVEITAFIDDMEAAMEWADLMICRAGALTVSEIAAVGLPSILVPFPYAIDDHQTENARYLADHGAAELVQESEFADGGLIDALKRVIGNRQKMLAMAVAAKKSAKLGAAGRFVDLCQDYTGELAVK